MNEQQNYGNFLGALGVILNVLNLIQNEQQTAYNDVHAANDEQAERLLTEINARFDELNNKLDRLLGAMEDEK